MAIRNVFAGLAVSDLNKARSVGAVVMGRRSYDTAGGDFAGYEHRSRSSCYVQPA